jgi:putative ABC transport system permease protein
VVGPRALLGRKLRRDLVRGAAQTLATALVVACAVAATSMAAGVRQSLTRSLHLFYEQQAFADVFSAAEFAPASAATAMAAIPGVRRVETRIATWASLLPAGTETPAVGRVLSLPAGRSPALNRPLIRAGRPPAAGEPAEILVNEPFADAHGLAPGDRLSMRLAGDTREYGIAGIALTPEAIFAVAPGHYVPDDRRFAIVWMAEPVVARALFYGDEFNEALLTLEPGANEVGVRTRVDAVLAPYDGTPAQGRAGQPSHAFVQSQLDQLAGLALLVPPVFLLVSACLLYAAVTRTVTHERQAIGVMTALGTPARRVRGHYVAQALVTAGVGCLLGVGLGAAMGSVLLDLYGRFFRFPALVRVHDIPLTTTAVAIALAVAWISARLAYRRIAAAPAAQLLRRPAPATPGFRPRLGWSRRSRLVFSQMLRQRARGLLTGGTAALAIGLIVATAFAFDALEHIVDVTGRQEQQDALLLAPSPVDAGAIDTLQAQPGIAAAEGFRTVMADLRAGGRRVTAPLVGLPADGRLRVLLTPDLDPIRPPADGIAVSTTLADLLEIGPGDRVELWLPGQPTPRAVTVRALTEQYFGVEAAVALATLDAWMGDGAWVTGARVTFDDQTAVNVPDLLARAPQLAGYVDRDASLGAFRSTMARTLTILVSFFLVLAVLTTIGVIFSNATVLAEERRRDVGLLRALGFSRREVGALLTIELLLPALLMAPLGLAAGRLFGWFVVSGLDNALFRVPFVVAPRTDAIAVGVALAAASAASLLAARTATRRHLATALADPE